MGSLAQAVVAGLISQQSSSMQSSGGGRSSARVRYRRPPSEDSEEPNAGGPGSETDEDSADPEVAPSAAAAATAAATNSATSSSSVSAKKNSAFSDAWSSAVGSLRDHPVLLAGLAAGVAATGGLLVLLSALRGRSSSSDHDGSKAASTAGSKGRGKAAAPSGPGPNSKVKPTATCVPLTDGSAVVVHRPIAADNSCLFNAVGYCMHHSTNRAPFLRQVVSREVSSDPQEYSAAFLGMENAAYCAWITNPAHWGGGIELAILASHYRREIAAWNLATGACHVFGEERGFTKRVMVIYNGVHYDALAISNGPRTAQEEDVTEFNPRTKRGKQILAAAQKLVQLNRKGKAGHQEQLDQQKEQEKQQRKARKQQEAGSSASSSKDQPVSNGHAAAAATQHSPQAVDGSNNSSSSTSNPNSSTAKVLSCQSCGEQLAGVDAARAHAAATGHVDFAEVE